MTSATQMKLEELSFIDQVRAIASEGLKYAKDSYDIDRYNKLLVLSAHHCSAITNIDEAKLFKNFESEIGVVTPKLGSDAAIINDKQQILVLKRTDDQSWCLPCGWVDVGESPADAAVRETKEETGLDVIPEYYISISHKGPQTASHLQHQVNTITLMRPVSSNGEVKLSREHSEFKWVAPSEIMDWHVGHDKQFKKISDFLQSDRRAFIAIS